MEKQHQIKLLKDKNIRFWKPKSSIALNVLSKLENNYKICLQFEQNSQILANYSEHALFSLLLKNKSFNLDSYLIIQLEIFENLICSALFQLTTRMSKEQVNKVIEILKIIYELDENWKNNQIDNSRIQLQVDSKNNILPHKYTMDKSIQNFSHYDLFSKNKLVLISNHNSNSFITHTFVHSESKYTQKELAVKIFDNSKKSHFINYDQLDLETQTNYTKLIELSDSLIYLESVEDLNESQCITLLDCLNHESQKSEFRNIFVVSSQYTPSQLLKLNESLSFRLLLSKLCTTIINFPSSGLNLKGDLFIDFYYQESLKSKNLYNLYFQVL